MILMLAKLFITVSVVLAATAIAGRFPSAGGLVSVMPLTGALVLVWTYVERSDKPAVVQDLARGALWGIAPSLLFLGIALLLLKWNLSLPIVLMGGLRGLAGRRCGSPMALELRRRARRAHQAVTASPTGVDTALYHRSLGRVY
ncbi:MAG: hypothetical protein FIB00_10905 [Chloroflexi bacterium]|nr:hypothetical protein [Chloroflexota bacterium]